MNSSIDLLIKRFELAECKVDALNWQKLLCGETQAQEKLAQAGQLKGIARGETIISQGCHSNSIFFILHGTFGIVRNGREIAERTAHDCVGEMAMIDKTQVRSATVFAKTESVVIEVSEPDFTKVAKDYPILWRKLAICEAGKVRERLKGVRKKNAAPIVFIGSSSENLDVAKAVETALSPVAEPRVWNKGVFAPTDFTLESLEKIMREVDYAVIVFGDDDIIKFRGKVLPAPRDNVVFELGMATGALGRERSFLMVKRGTEVKLPSDLSGRNLMTYETNTALEVAVLEGCADLINIIKERGTL